MKQNTACGQTIFEKTAPLKYRIEFTDKLNDTWSIDKPGEFLSERALIRRQKQNIDISPADLPVSRAYIDSLKNSGIRVLHVSRWFNAATIEINDSAELEKISGFSFIKKKTGLKQSVSSPDGYSGVQSVLPYNKMGYGSSWLQIALHNGQTLHEKGYTGNGLVIAVIDAGFAYADRLPVFDYLWENNRILGTRDFVEPGNNVFLEATHGMSVLSIIGGFKEGELTGTAPDASFWLLRSEDTRSEYIIEEDNWIAAVEFADSAGTDIIQSSLGYTVFNDSMQNHTYEDLNGNKTRISKAADMAASRGMLVVVSAGNLGNAEWYHISAPADADSVITVGAVDRYGTAAVFSSRGPSSDGQVKPNVMAIGMGTYVASVDSSIKPGNGTSYAAPVITGLAACLWQANPDAAAMQVYSAICESADRFYQPDAEYGYGIPDFNLANVLLKASTGKLDPVHELVVYPNPFHHQLYIFFADGVDDPVDITLYDVAGKMVFRKIVPGFSGRKYAVVNEGFQHLGNGLYIMRVNAGPYSGNSKLSKY